MQINNTPIYIGTSGYKFDDWKDVIYPSYFRNEDMLSYYSASGLEYLELSFTFYKCPTVDDIQNIVTNGGNNMNYTVRLLKEFLHNRDADETEFKEGLKPMIEEGRMKGYMADFHTNFAPSQKNLAVLERLRDKFSDFPIFMSLQNRSWYRQQYIEELDKLGIIRCTVDKKGIPFRMSVTGNHAYFRLFGTSGGIDHLYTPLELNRLYKHIESASLVCKSVFVVFANVAKGNAPRNAKQLQAIIKDKGK